MRLILRMSLTAFFILSASAAQVRVDSSETRVDRLFEAWNNPDTPGAAVAVVRDGRPLLAKGYGCADLEHGTPLTPKTLINAASLAKQFTALSVLMLEAEGKLSLDDDVRTHLPEFPDFGRKITIRHLLYHTSGLRDWGGLVQMAGGRIDDVVTTSSILKLVFRQRELHFEPGTEFAYCNAGYNILAEIVARASGLSFTEWTRTNIFLPLGMAGANFRDDLGKAFPGSARSYYRTAEARYSRALDNEAAPGPGSLLLSIEDMSRWLAAIETQAVIPSGIWAKMFEKGTLADGGDLPYAAGLIVGRSKGLTSFYHSGRWAGFQSGMVYFPEHSFSVAVLANNSSVNAIQLSRRIADIYLEGQTPSSLSPPPAVDVGSSVLEAYVGRYWLQGEQTIEIKRKENHLYAQMSGDLPIEIFAEAVDTFAYRVIDAKIQFHRAGPEKASKLTFWREAAALAAERLPEEKWSPSDLTEFCGRYVSEELGALLEVKLGEKGLVIPFIRRNDLFLIPIAKDRFGGRDSSAKFSFHRGSDGRVAGLNFSLLDARNVRFARIGNS